METDTANVIQLHKAKHPVIGGEGGGGGERGGETRKMGGDGWRGGGPGARGRGCVHALNTYLVHQAAYVLIFSLYFFLRFNMTYVSLIIFYRYKVYTIIASLVPPLFEVDICVQNTVLVYRVR